MKKIALLGFYVSISVPVLVLLYYLLLGCTSTTLYGLPDFAKSLSYKVSSEDFVQTYLFLISLGGLILSILSIFIKEPPKTNTVLSNLSLFLSFFICALVIIVSSSNATARQKPSPAGYARIIFTQVQTDIKNLKNESFLPTTSCAGENSIFEKVLATERATLLQKVTLGTPHCISTSKAWAISLNVKNRGGLMCKQREIWCTDSTGYVGLANSEVTGPKCN